jgi:hypothetical protein
VIARRAMGILGLMATCGAVVCAWYWLQSERARQASYDEITRQGVEAAGLVDGVFIDPPPDGDNDGVHWLMVRYFSDGTPGPPRPSGSGFPDLWGPAGMPRLHGVPGMPGMPGLGGMGPTLTPRGTRPAVLPFDSEVSIVDGRIVAHSVSEGQWAVSSATYDETQIGQTVPVKYLAEEPGRFIVVGQPSPNGTVPATVFLGVVGLGLAWQLVRMLRAATEIRVVGEGGQPVGTRRDKPGW